jgi:hypothetical protein
MVLSVFILCKVSRLRDGPEEKRKSSVAKVKDDAGFVWRWVSKGRSLDLKKFFHSPKCRGNDNLKCHYVRWMPLV